MLLAKGTRIPSIREGLDFTLQVLTVELECHFRRAVELMYVAPDAHPARAGPPGDFSGHVRALANGASQEGNGLRLSVGFSGRFNPYYRQRCTRSRYAQGLCLLPGDGWGEDPAILHDDFHYHI